MIEKTDKMDDTNFRVPDAIGTVEGWRAFRFKDGLLYSPQQDMPWPPNAKAQAFCLNNRWTCQWALATMEQRVRMEQEALASGFTAAVGHNVQFLMPTGDIETVPVYMPYGMGNHVLPPIKFYPPPGMEWVLTVKEFGHPAPKERCNCGIHIAKNLDMALQYAPSSGRVFGFVKGWGKVIPAHHGWRVEFAYPVELYVDGTWRSVGPRVREWVPNEYPELEAYGVPIGARDEIDLIWREYGND
jgi:hypothetical protein